MTKVQIETFYENRFTGKCICFFTYVYNEKFSKISMKIFGNISVLEFNSSFPCIDM